MKAFNGQSQKLWRTRKLILLLVAAGSISAASTALASSSSYGAISTPLVIENGYVFFYHSGTRTTAPGCATEPRWVFDGNTTSGQTKMALLLTAFSTNRQVVINGTGSCALWGDTETVSSIQVGGYAN